MLVYNERAELLQHDATCAVLRQRRQNGTLSADIAEEGAHRSLALELSILSATIEKGVVGSDCVMELDVDLLTTVSTVLDFLFPLPSLVFPPRLLGLLVLYEIPVSRNACCKNVNDVACGIMW